MRVILNIVGVGGVLQQTVSRVDQVNGKPVATQVTVNLTPNDYYPLALLNAGRIHQNARVIFYQLVLTAPLATYPTFLFVEVMGNAAMENEYVSNAPNVAQTRVMLPVSHRTDGSNEVYEMPQGTFTSADFMLFTKATPLENFQIRIVDPSTNGGVVTNFASFTMWLDTETKLLDNKSNIFNRGKAAAIASDT